MLRKAFYIAVAGLFLAACSSNKYEAEKAVTQAEMSGQSLSEQMQQQQEMLANELRPVYFEVGSAKLTDRFEKRLDENAKVLKNNPEFKIYVTGHTDSRGSESMNWELGMKRAKAVHDYLVSQGVSSDRIYTISKGENDPKVSATDESYYQINRRVDFEPFTTGSALAE